MAYVCAFYKNNLAKTLLVFLLCCSLYIIPINANGIRISKEEDLELEQQLKRLNKPAVKTIESKYGVLYDCVDFYKQPAFDHPLLKNHNFHFQMRPPSMPKSTTGEKSYVTNNTKVNYVNLEVLDCPFGTVPIRRVTKDYLIRNKLHEERIGRNAPDIYLAVVQTKNQEGVSYSGAGTILSVHRPAVFENSQYTSSRIQIQNGVDYFQYGWMVNPTLYGDDRTYGFTYLKTSQSQCFNLLCPGFVLIRPDYPIDEVITDVSIFRGEKFIVPFLIYRDELNGNWWLAYGPNNIRIGFWPAEIFTDLASKATGVQWGGEVSSPYAVKLAEMGSGYYVKSGTMKYNAYCERMTTVNDAYKIVNAENTETYAGSGYYDVVDKGYVDSYSRHLMFYGGTRGGAD